MSGARVRKLTLVWVALFGSPLLLLAQSDPLDPTNPAKERIWLGGRLIAVDTLPAQMPNAFTFSDQSGVAASTLTNSNILQITGLGFPTEVSISGTGSPQYRICSTSNCSSVVQTWTSSGFDVANNQYLQLRLTSGPVASSRSATAIVGGVADEWGVASEGADSTPAGFNFTDQTNVALSTLVNSNILQITGINVAVTVTISGSGGSPQYRTCTTSNCSSVIQDWTSASGTISNGQYLQLRLTSSPLANTARNASVNVGTGSDAWYVTTRPSGNITLTTSGSWNVPAGVTSVSVTSTGGGAGGGGGGTLYKSSSTLWDSGYDECGPYEVWGGYITGGGGGGGGGAGAVSGPTNLSVTPGSNINYTVGSGGGGGSLNTAGSTGVTTTFVSVSASGGTGGGSGSGGNGGTGGSSGGASGSSGQMCQYWEVFSYFCGAMGEQNDCGEYGTGNAAGGGSGYGAGGAGGAGYNLESGSTGTSGSAGRIVITWP